MVDQLYSPTVPVASGSDLSRHETRTANVNDTGRAKKPIVGSLLLSAALIFAAIAGLYAFSITFSQFSFYDDEGFMMISVQGFLTGHALYDQVYTAYGPFYYFYQWLVHSLTSLPVSHDVTRALCVFHWLAAAVVLAFAGGLMTRSPWVAFLVFMQAIVHLTGLAREPGHPQELVALLLACSALVLGARLEQKWKLIGLGAICATLTLTKVNVGAFFAFALMLAFAACTPTLRSRRVFFWIFLALASLLPFLLMRLHLDRAWARQFAWVVGAAIFGVGVVGSCSEQRQRLGLTEWLQTGTAFACSALPLIGFVLLLGSSVSELVNCLVVSPSKIAQQLSVPVYAPYSYLSAAASLGSVLLWHRMRRDPDSFSPGVTAAKFAYGVVGAFVLFDSCREQLGYLTPWLWLVVVGVPRQGRAMEKFSPRLVICLVAAWESLQAYPVAGTQATVGTFLLVLAYSLCLHDAISAILAQPSVRSQITTLVQRAVAVQVLLLLCLVDVFAFKWCWPNWLCQGYRYLTPLALSGARRLHLPADQVENYRTVSEYLREECDSFITYPGANSLYFWTGKKPPTYFNVAEIILLDECQQVEVLKALRQLRKPLVVTRERSGTRSSDTAGPLLTFIHEHCVEVKRIGAFRILTPTERAPILLVPPKSSVRATVPPSLRAGHLL